MSNRLLNLVLTKHDKFSLVNIVDEVQSVFDILYEVQEYRAEPLDYQIVLGEPYSIRKLNFDLERYYYSAENALNQSNQIFTNDNVLIGYPVSMYKVFLEIIENRCKSFPERLTLVSKGDYKRKIFEQESLYSKYNIPRQVASDLIDVIKYLESTKTNTLSLELLRGLLKKPAYKYQLKDAVHTVNRLKARGYSIKVNSRSGRFYDYTGDNPVLGGINDSNSESQLDQL